MNAAPPPRSTKVEDLAEQFVDAVGFFVTARMRDGRYSRMARLTREDATNALVRLLREVAAIVRGRST